MLTVGEILKKEREKKGLSFEEIEKRIKVRRHFLQAIEQNDWSLFTSKIYIAGVIKNYSQVLGLNHENVLAFFRREYAKKEDVSFKRRVTKSLLTPETRRVVYGISAGVILVFLLYFSYQVMRFVQPPSVVILEPKEESFRRVQEVEIVGKTEREAVVTILGNRVFQDKDGVFRYDFPLKAGKNTVSIEVIGANGKKSIVTKQYVLSP